MDVWQTSKDFFKVRDFCLNINSSEIVQPSKVYVTTKKLLK